MTNVTYAYFKSKDEEQAFLMTGSDIGFTKWDNELKEALLRAPLTFRQYKVFDAIHRLTIGWNKQCAHIENTRIGKMAAIHHTHVSKVRKELENMNMIVKHNNEVSINQNYHEWSFNKSLAESAKHKRQERNILKHKLPQTPSLTKSKSFDPSSVELPDWLPKPTWDSWIQYRKEINKPIKSQQTVTQAVKLLGKCRENGNSPEKIINASIANGWQGLFEPNQPGRTQQTKPHSVTDSFADKDYGTTQIPDWARDCP
ncbi:MULTISPECIES: replication protein [Symbiopectobacterium]|uniref:replication protein n=1 Tax=Symbiopectobacterium TaxID=801 RepID=UPI001A25C4A3|nr:MULTISPECIES: replication protein [Symbiopectobacterium]MBG6249464.1 replication protein [Candidatus Symbiopectobacterium sp. PLON1]MBT9428897.1 replication protein [Candidatus Symbiopectobacterium endolongispinus]